MPYLFTSESVSEGHPDKIADQISDAVLDAFLRNDTDAKVACEVLVTTGLVSINGEVKSETYVDLQTVARNVIKRIGYTKAEYRFDNNSCAIISTLHEQSPDINQGVVRQTPAEQGAGDQGIMFGYASNETDNYMPLTLELSHLLVQELAAIRREGNQMTYLRPDAKSQVTIEYSDDHTPLKVHTLLISTQHDDFADETTMHKQITNDIKHILLPRVKANLPKRAQAIFNDDSILHVNPTGRFVI
jgi:S-adenosylmethionine synthetase